MATELKLTLYQELKQYSLEWTHHMGLFMDKSIETSHGKIHHMERTDKSVFARKKNPYFGI